MNATDKRFFWLALYAQPGLWVALAVVAIVKLEPIWLTLVVIALVLTVTNTVAFSRCDKFSQASGLVERGLYSGSLVSAGDSCAMGGLWLTTRTGTERWGSIGLATVQPRLLTELCCVIMFTMQSKRNSIDLLQIPVSTAGHRCVSCTCL